MTVDRLERDMRFHRRHRLAIALIGSVVLVLPACGGESDDSAPSASESESQQPSTPAEPGADPFDLIREAASHMPMTADALATGFDSALKLPGNAGSDAAALRAQLTYLLTEHVYLAGIAVDTAYVTGADSPEFKLAAQTLDANSVALSEAVGSIAGDKQAETFLTAWRSHIDDFVAYAVAAKEGDEAGKREALRNLAAYQRTAGQFFAEVTGGALPASAVRASLAEHVETLTAAIDAFAAGDPSGFDKLKAAADHMPMTATALADGIDQAADIAGNPNDQASEVRAALNGMLTAHVYLSGIGVFTAYVDGADSPAFAAAAGTIDANSVELADAVTSLTDQATGESFLQSWRSHIDDFVAYAVAVAGDDQQAQDEAQANLQAYAEVSGTNFEEITGGALTAAAVQHEFEMHIASLSEAIDALAQALIR
jgi:hypothetical protein